MGDSWDVLVGLASETLALPEGCGVVVWSTGLTYRQRAEMVVAMQTEIERLRTAREAGL